MDLSNVYVIDIEADGLLDTVSKIHVMSVGYQDENGAWQIISTPDYEKMKSVMEDENNVIVGHNYKNYDAIALEKVLGIETKAVIIDTLSLSWALYPWERVHGLEFWGNKFGVPKPEIDDWENLSYEEYRHRCEEDVKINIHLWEKMLHKLSVLYNGDTESVKKYINYINFKMEVLGEQEKYPIKVDVEKLEENLTFFEEMKEQKIEALKPHMPEVRVYATKKRPKVCFKKDGSLSKAGQDWFELLEKAGLPEDYDEEVRVIKDYKEPNPQSHSQVKDWLFSLGWKPRVFKPSSSQTENGEPENIPQVRIDGMLCESVLELVEVEPAIEELDGLSVIVHRLGVLNSIKKNLRDGHVVAGAGGLTNTLRFQHRAPICNLPGVMKLDDQGERVLRDGRYIRELFIAEEGCLYLGVDLSSLEDRSKQHFIFTYDPEYVESMMQEGFDPHLDLAVFAGALTEEQAQKHKNKEEDHGKVRHQYKQANYSCTYLVGAKTLAKAIKSSVSHAQSVIDAFWKKNWAVKQFADDQKVVKFEDEDWIINPLNGFRYWLKTEKDRFSTLNQGGGTYIFDVWLHIVRSKGVTVSMNIHDEFSCTRVRPGEEDEFHKICKESIQEVNEMLGLLRDMDCDVQFGKNYAEVH